MNTKAKGAALERRAMDLLGQHGYVCEKARASYAHRMTGRPIATSHDFFTCFDIIAKRRGNRTLWIQVTTKNVSIASKVEKMRPVLASFDPLFDDVQVWRWHSPDRPGLPGKWQVLAWDDEFSHRSAFYLTGKDISLPWDEAE